MQYRDLFTLCSPPFDDCDFLSMARRLCERQGLISRARQRETPHLVDVVGLTRGHLTDPGEFEREFRLRIEWCHTYAPDFAIEIIEPNSDEIQGRRFRIRDISIAALFRGSFPTDLTRKASRVG